MTTPTANETRSTRLDVCTINNRYRSFVSAFTNGILMLYSTVLLQKLEVLKAIEYGSLYEVKFCVSLLVMYRLFTIFVSMFTVSYK